MKHNYLNIVKAYAALLRNETGVPVIIVPSEVTSERFHVSLTLLAHPNIVGNGRVRFRLRATVFAEIPASDEALDDCLKKSLALALFFDEARGFEIKKEAGKAALYGVSYHRALRDDDELFSELESEGRSYSYSESWLVELEFKLCEIA